jgi:hypothetical protein
MWRHRASGGLGDRVGCRQRGLAVWERAKPGAAGDVLTRGKLRWANWMWEWRLGGGSRRDAVLGLVRIQEDVTPSFSSQLGGLCGIVVSPLLEDGLGSSLSAPPFLTLTSVTKIGRLGMVQETDNNNKKRQKILRSAGCQVLRGRLGKVLTRCRKVPVIKDELMVRLSRRQLHQVLLRNAACLANPAIRLTSRCPALLCGLVWLSMDALTSRGLGFQ